MMVLAATDIYDSGGPLMPEQAAYDVSFYELSLFVNPRDSSIHGSLRVDAQIVQPIDMFVLDLDTLLKLDSVKEITNSKTNYLQYIHKNGKIWINLNWTRQAGEKIAVQIDYGGRPRVAPSPPWSGGSTWSYTADGSPWIATSCQGEGADIWWPNKDHVSDKPDSMRINIRIQDPLVVASNGRLESIKSHDDSTSTYHWFVSTPISSYNVALNIAPYKVIEEDYISVTGETIPVSFWVLPEDYEQGVAFFPEILQHLEFYEKQLGPYPFRADKYGVAQTPHLGMEHQTIIAYGARFNNSAMTMGKDWGFDALHHHELAHEWWGNVITCSDWRDMWIHEGFGTYMQALYLEETQGIELYHQYLKSIRNFLNITPVAPEKSLTSNEISTSAVYFKGAWILHSLRYLLGEDMLNQLLRRMIYPDHETEQITDGRQIRFVSTNDFLYLAETLSGKDLDWFFNIYLRQTELPVLVSKVYNTTLKIRWEVPEDLDFPMPVEVKIGDKIQRIEIPKEGTEIKFEDGMEPEIDPDKWLLYRQPYPDVVYLDSSDLDTYIGKYELKIRNRTRAIEISKENESLLLKTGRLPQIRMFPSSKSEFFFREAENIRITFTFDDNGEVESLTHNFFQRTATFKKVK
jgi:aminopeptidase N